ncbi:MAG: hypothetical protein CM15mV89_0310 [Caudoviricetes sp.]|nr:MAG: hypothetical protein CM15mV89_0310 [Caudoviricetes sp.]
MFSFLCDEAQLPNVQAASGTLKGRYLGEGQINYAHTRGVYRISIRISMRCFHDTTKIS